MKRFGVITNKSKDGNLEVTKKIEELISSLGGECVLFGDPLNGFKDGFENDKVVFDKKCRNLLKNLECIIVLGGDGTIIETARALDGREIPIVGINLGTLGFLSCIEKNQTEYAIKELVEDRFSIEERMLLKVTSSSNGKISTCLALNDVTVTRGGFSRIIRTDVFVNGEAVGSYLGDGCLVSTPTGSTGYNLSAGGPIVTPEAKLMCITPICPHTLNNRSIVVSGNDKIRIVIGEKKKYQDIESFATIDGQMAVRLNIGDYIDVEKADAVTKFVRFPEQSYFSVLKAKLDR
ncbi:MAG: NAD(+)/NADH kinase [Lachnospiraceae bacterium]|nr:NAD(+)/NADH kinase [Lachnospiraceae bacterium]